MTIEVAAIDEGVARASICAISSASTSATDRTVAGVIGGAAAGSTSPLRARTRPRAVTQRASRRPRSSCPWSARVRASAARARGSAPAARAATAAIRGAGIGARACARRL